MADWRVIGAQAVCRYNRGQWKTLARTGFAVRDEFGVGTRRSRRKEMARGQQIKSVRIRHYRGFRDLTMDLGRLNLVTGRNNAGKSSLLEAVFLLCGFGNPGLLLKRTINRSSGALHRAADAVNTAFWAPLFWQLEPNEPICVHGTHQTLGTLDLTISDCSSEATVTFPAEGRGNEGLERVGNDLQQGGPVLAFHFTQGSDPRSHESRGTLRLNRDQSSFESRASGHRVLFPADLITPRLATPEADAARLGKLRQHKAIQPVVEALRIIEPRLRDIEEMSLGGSARLWANIDGMAEFVPLSTLGDGINWLARLLLGVANARNGVFLIDEIETGIHYTVLPQLWQVIDAAARAANAQVIATTHSHECVEAAADALDLDGGVLLHRLEASDDGARCHTFSAEHIRTAMKFNMETR